MDWAFIYLMFILKIPIVGLLWIVWWAIHQTPEPTEESRDDRGGSDRRGFRHPREPHPRPPRRGPHADPLPPSPPRVRGVTARGRELRT